MYHPSENLPAEAGRLVDGAITELVLLLEKHAAAPVQHQPILAILEGLKVSLESTQAAIHQIAVPPVPLTSEEVMDRELEGMYGSGAKKAP